MWGAHLLSARAEDRSVPASDLAKSGGPRPSDTLDDSGGNLDSPLFVRKVGSALLRW
jgi:hypothetical protein